MRANAAFVLLCSFVVFLTACADGGSGLPSSGGTPPGGGTTLVFLTTSLPAATENVQYNATISAAGSVTGNYTWNISTGTPTGTFSSGGSTPGQLDISGLFTPAGSYTFDVTVGDGAGQSLKRAFTIVVNASPSVALVAMPYTGAWEDQSFQTQFYAQGGTQPFTWSMPSGTLPAGLSLTPQNSFANLGGTPTQSGQFNFTLRVDDSAGQFATLNYQLYVFPARSWTALSGAPTDQQGSVCLDLFNQLWVWGGLSGTTPGQGQPINTGYSWPLSGSTSPITMANAPSPRFAHSAVSTGSAMIVFGGRDNSSVLGDGKKLTFSPQSWSAISATGAPSARNGHSAVWTGTEMIVWGGVDPLGNTLNDGAAYNPTSDTWRAISSVGAPMSRANHRAQIVGGRMVVFGGVWSSTTSIPGELYDGGIYDIAADSWATFGSFGSGTDATPTLVCPNVAEALIWGLPGTNQGVTLTLPSQSYGYLATLNAPTARAGHSATWTGKYMVIFGGETTGLLNDGAAYNPATDTWISNATGAPQARKNHKAFWIGHQVLIFGGEGLNGSGQPVMLGAAALYTP
ncbi:hypothetical protein GPROT1_02140 [Gammaproteobacteria bacterium]|nr:hypothetical protein GPROT1_02140 [Gammaproteobacteria bacterium]